MWSLCRREVHRLKQASKERMQELLSLCVMMMMHWQQVATCSIEVGVMRPGGVEEANSWWER